MLVMEPPTRTDEQTGTIANPSPGPDWLLARLDALAARFALVSNDEAGDALRAEAAALAGAGLAHTALLACVAACVCRHADGGPAVAHGAWADSVLLAWCGAVLPADVATAADGGAVARATEPAFLAQAAGDQPDVGPVLLLPDTADPALLDLIAKEAARFDLQPESVIREGQARLSIAGDYQAGTRGRAPVTLRASRLWRCVCLAARLHDERHDCRCHPVAPLALEERDVLARLSSPWAAVLPETPPWLARPWTPADRGTWERRWLEEAGSQASEPVCGALRARAALVWQAASLAALDPAIGWSALLAAVAPGRLPDALAAARRDAALGPTGQPMERAPAWEAADGERAGSMVHASPVGAAHDSLSAVAMAGSGAGVIGKRRFHYAEQDLWLLALAGAAGGTGAASDPAASGDLGALPETTESAFPAAAGEPQGADRDGPEPWLLMTVHETPDADVEGSPLLSLLSTAQIPLTVSPQLTTLLVAGQVTIGIPLRGDRHGDLDLLNAVVAVLHRHEGPQRARVFLERGQARRSLDLPGMAGVVWSSRLAAELATVLGPGRVVWEPAIAPMPGP